MAILRAQLLGGRRIVLAGTAAAPLAAALGGLGAELESLSGDRLAADEEHVGEWAREHAPLQALVWDGAGAFGEGGEDALNATLEEAWAIVREVAVGALIPARAPAKLLLIAPRPDAGPLVEAARAGLESLVRTLSVEWARYGVSSVLLSPGPATTNEQLAESIGFLVSEAGGYLSGCRMELGVIA